MAASGNALSLDRYAQILGINPVHFNGAVGQSVWPLKNNACSDVWPRHSWQYSDSLSLEELAHSIRSAEEDIEAYLGYPVAPRWIAKEMHPYPHYHRPETVSYGASNVRGQYKGIRLKKGKLIQGGRRATTLLENVTVAAGTLLYSDEDGDGFAETATITATVPAGTEACEIKVYFADTNAMIEWEIRPARSKTVSGTTFTGIFYSWLFIDPDTLAAHPSTSTELPAVDITTTANYVAEVDVYREYTDTTQSSAEFIWENSLIGQPVVFCTSCGGVGCVACSASSQDGCLQVRDVDAGLAVAIPATYDETNEVWNGANWTECYDPDMVRVWYYAGDVSDEYLAGRSCDPLRSDLARAIAMMATARVEREFCSCGNVSTLAYKWRVDMAMVGEDNNYRITFSQLDNPFGTRYGEVAAWKQISRLKDALFEAALI